MRRIRVCIYGGTDLQGTPTRLVSAIAYEVLRRMNAVIVTGGFLHSVKKPRAMSTDAAALEGARRYCQERGYELANHFEAWIPDPALDLRKDVGAAVRMSKADNVTVNTSDGKTPLGRRLAMVRQVDIVITISGHTHTEIVGEQALELGIPFLPIPVAGGDSEVLLDTYRPRIAESFAEGALEQCLKEIVEQTPELPTSAADAVVNLLLTAKIRKCLVLSPFDDKHQNLYQTTIEPAVARHMIPIRLDRLADSGVIFSNLAEAFDQASAVIVDITGLNKNVMYEIGFAHGRTLTPLIYTTEPSLRDQLPVYLSSRNVLLVDEHAPLERLIDEYLDRICNA